MERTPATATDAQNPTVKLAETVEEEWRMKLERFSRTEVLRWMVMDGTPSHELSWESTCSYWRLEQVTVDWKASGSSPFSVASFFNPLFQIDRCCIQGIGMSNAANFHGASSRCFSIPQRTAFLPEIRRLWGIFFEIGGTF
ncbi:hypothetical protein H6P81_005373 [Aristolochia fimbriata]|uniref:Uncharacterized protein n=1 Tax=Aristolochia fimbriata TaxID=158543 RepID=A0AAV7EVP4_ARIFI|nr:hypothetical protein H6P81_005373 [Aristolochia fimbriata]